MFQFAKVIERDSISHTDLSHITPPRYGDCDFRRSTCEHSLADVRVEPILTKC